MFGQGSRKDTVPVATKDSTVFQMNGPVEKVYWLKTSLDAGYFGDAQAAHHGIVVSLPVQSLGQLQLHLFSGFKYWKTGSNRGREFFISKSLPGYGTMLPDNLFLSFREIHYREKMFSLRQARALIVEELPFNFSFDAGAAYAEIETQEHGHDAYFSGVISLTKVFERLPGGDLGVYTSMNYHRTYSFYEAGLFKTMVIRKLTAITFMGKYYNYKTTEGFMFSVVFTVFSTRYYCCSTRLGQYDYLNLFR